MVKILQRKIPMMKFNSIGQDKFPLREYDIFNLDKIKERSNKIVDAYAIELREALLTEYSEEEVIHFLEIQINRLINQYQKRNDSKT